MYCCPCDLCQRTDNWGGFQSRLAAISSVCVSVPHNTELLIHYNTRPSIVAETHVTKMQTKEEVLCFKFVVHWLKILPTFLAVYNKEQIHCVEQNTV